MACQEQATAMRLQDLRSVYELLDLLSKRIGGPRKLGECSRSTGWPDYGVYFFFEDGENRCDFGRGPRVVRVGTHAIKPTSKNTLWDRLSNHRGQVRSSGGNHWNSIFRHHVGDALIEKHQLRSRCPTWRGDRRDATLEREVEEMVSKTIRAMPLMWIEVRESRMRDYVERNAIALLSNFNRPVLDPPSSHWLGAFCKSSDKVKSSGLWNDTLVMHSTYDPKFIDRFQDLVKRSA